VSEEARSYIVVGGCHSINVSCINNSLERFVFFLEVVVSLLVYDLPKKLNRWLCSVFFLDWHVEVINEKYYFACLFGT